MPELMTTREVAAYLRLKERKIYELVRQEQIPCIRLTGKLMFPRAVIDRWLLGHTEFAGPALHQAPPVVAGSHDPLLEWALRESGSNLALLSGGSEDGVRRLAAGEAVVAGMHIIDPEGGYNIATVRDLYRLADVVLVTWAEREQGLVLAAGNPLHLDHLADAATKQVRVAQRQEGAGAQTLLRHLLHRDGLALGDLNLVAPPCLTETDLAVAVLDGKADCGLAVAAVARQFRLDFALLHRERFDLLLRRRDYFEPPVQSLLHFAQTAAFRERAASLGGYDLSRLGAVAYNA